jgi:hypothetical protein
MAPVTRVAHEPVPGPSAPSVTVPESFVRKWRATLRQPANSPSAGAAACGASLQIIQTIRSFCLRVSGAVAPSAPKGWLTLLISPASSYESKILKPTAGQKQEPVVQHARSAPSPHSASKARVNALVWGRVGEGSGASEAPVHIAGPPPHRKSGLPDLRIYDAKPGQARVRGEGNRPRRVRPVCVQLTKTCSSSSNELVWAASTIRPKATIAWSSIPLDRQCEAALRSRS